MRAYTFSEFIGRPPRDVWRVLTDLGAAPRWRPLIRSMETEDGGPLALGSRVRIVIDFHGRQSTRVSVTSAFEPEKKWTLHSSETPAVEGFFDFTLQAEGSGTRVQATCDLIAHELLPWIFLPLIARGERRRRVEMLPNLKRLVESAGA